MTPEEFLQIAEPLPEPTLLLSGKGIILAANRATGERLGVAPRELQGRRLVDAVTEPPEEVAHYLRACSRSRKMVLGALTLYSHGGPGIPCRTEGAVVRPKGEASDSLLLLRLIPKESATGQFVALNQRIEELGREIQRRKQAEEAARQQEERLRVTLHSIGDAVIVTDLEGRVTLMNNVAESLTGWTQNEAIRRPLGQVLSIVNEDNRKTVENPALRALKEGLIVGLANHTILIAKDGTERPIDDSAAPIRDGQGEVIGAVLVFRDISHRKEAAQMVRASEERFKAFMENSPALAYIKDAEGRYVYVNPVLERDFDRPLAAWVGKTDADLFPPEPARQYRQNDLSVLASRKTARFMETATQPDGLHHYLSFKFPLQDRDGRCLLAGMSLDITEQRQAEQALRTGEQRLRFIMDSMPQKIFTAKPNGDLDYFNPIWEEFTGLSFEQIRDWGWTQFIHPDEVAENVRVWKHSVETGEPFQFEHRFQRGDGEYRWHLSRALPMRDEAGQVLMWVGSNTDIHDVKQAEQRTQFLADASASLAELNDPESTLQKVAGVAVPAFADWCVVDLLDDEGRRLHVAVTHTDPDKVSLAKQLTDRYPFRPDDPHGIGHVLRTGKPELFEDIPESLLSQLAHDAEHLRLLRGLGLKSYICAPMVFRDRTLGVLCFIMAESGRRFKDADLSLAEELARRAAVTIENANLYRALREEDRRKDEFLAVLAHELRNPMAPLRNGLQIMRLAGNNQEAVSQARTMMERQLHHLVRLVDDLLDVSRISRGKFELRKERIALAAVVSHALETCDPIIKQCGHELTLTIPGQPIYVDADKTRLAQALCNLMSNAAKYTEHGGRIWLTVERQGSDAVISVKDTGVGIPPHMLPQVFDMFTQIDRSLEKAQGGLGIGLTIVKRLIEMHGGSIEARSEGHGMGSEFLIRLPVALSRVEEQQGEESADQRTGSNARRRILVVDDNVDAATSLAMMLKLTGNDIRTAHDGLEGVEVASAYRPDLILLDIGMPRLNGYDACRCIREQPWGRDVVIVALTGWGQDEDRRRSQEAGFDYHLTKPVEPAALEKLLASLKTATA